MKIICKMEFGKPFFYFKSRMKNWEETTHGPKVAMQGFHQWGLIGCFDRHHIHISFRIWSPAACRKELLYLTASPEVIITLPRTVSIEYDARPAPFEISQLRAKLAKKLSCKPPVRTIEFKESYFLYTSTKPLNCLSTPFFATFAFIY